ncbi:hypothetical protein BDU57DRAFT_570002 [Ampelomyces quisqualis]|uniref:Uncharacterized protein n=1 Tax=Ampelomyces quisqualis TaxID=50730 RepID=A0A6A5QX66_AMPQU|nr:hypothetical protein BDU57DRAFT_570002 [Ampelomyces quisqualis]
MSPLPIPTSPSTTLNWADDDDDDFDFESWKATADISAPPPSSLPPLQLPEPDPEPTYTTGESAPWTISTSAPKHQDKQKIDWSTTDFRCAKPMLAWRAVEKAPGMSAYKEMGDCWGTRNAYAQTWASMKAESGRDCRVPVQFRGSGLSVLEVIVEEEDDIAIIGQEDAEVVDQDGGVEVKQEFENPPVDLALEDKVELEILQGDLAPAGLPLELEISSAETIDLAPCSNVPLPSLSDLHDISLTRPIPLELAQHEGYSNLSASTTVYPSLSSLGLSPAATFANPGRKHGRRDSQQAFKDDGKTYGVSDDVEADIEDTKLDYSGTIVPLNDIEGIQDAASPGSKDAYPAAPISDLATTGWHRVLTISWTTAALVTAGVLAGGAMCFARRR